MNNQVIRVTALATVAIFTLSGASCIPTQNCYPEKSPDGYNTGRMICPVGQKGGQYAMQIAEGASSTATWRSWLANVLLIDSLAQQTLPLSTATFDASLVRLSTNGSDVPPAASNGQFTVSLYQGKSLLASTPANWFRSGGDIFLSDPVALNAWVRQYPGADGFSYSGHIVFQPASAESVTIQTSHVYAQTVTASSTATYSAPKPGSRTTFQEP